MPAYRNCEPMRGSRPMPWRTASMSAPSTSARLASSFMKLMRVASMALAAYLVSSALRTSISTSFSWLRLNGAYSWRISLVPRGSSLPTTMRSGRMKSSMAAPSFRNSGLLTTENATLAPRLSTSSWMAVAHLVGGADRHGRLVDHDHRPGDALADAAGGRQDVGQVGAAVFVRRRAHRQEHARPRGRRLRRSWWKTAGGRRRRCARPARPGQARGSECRRR